MRMSYTSNISFKPSCTSLAREDKTNDRLDMLRIKYYHQQIIRSMSPFGKGDSGGFEILIRSKSFKNLATNSLR